MPRGCRHAQQFRRITGYDALLDSKKKWNKNAFALTPSGSFVGPLSRVACSWCISGAKMKIEADLGINVPSGSYVSSQVNGFLMKAIDDIDGKLTNHIPDFNDKKRTTFNKVKKVIARAIELAKRHYPEPA